VGRSSRRVTEFPAIDERFNGPPGVGQGGYVAGMLASRICGPAEVSLRSPAPLRRALEVDRADDGSAHLLDGETLVAEARGVDSVGVEAPDPVESAAAEAAAARYTGFEDHLFDTCFVCGPAREDSFGVFAGPVEGRELVASPWIPRRECADQSGAVRPEFVWAVLDCPTYFATCLDGERPRSMLARLTAELREPVRADRRHVVTAWPISKQGRKHTAGSAIFTDRGEPTAVAEALMIELKPR
jgi:hypothetical protein